MTKLPKNTRIIIDPELKALIPPLSEDEFKQLRENIIESGECRDPLVTWYQVGTKGDYVLLDGHNRWKVIQEFINSDNPISFDWTSETLDSRNEAKAWMIRNQLGRRNLPNYERARLALQLKPLLAEEAKKRQAEYYGNQYDGLPQKSAEVQEGKKSDGEVREQLAKVAGVSHDTIHKVDVIEQKAAPEVKEQLRKGEVSINKVYQEIRPSRKRKIERQDDTPHDYFHAPNNVKKEFDRISNAYAIDLAIAAILCERQAENEADEVKKSMLNDAAINIAHALWYFHSIYGMPLKGLEVHRDGVFLAESWEREYIKLHNE